MKSKLNLIGMVVVLFAMLVACNNSKNTESGMTLTGTVNGAADGTIIELSSRVAGVEQKHQATIKNEKFEIKADYPIPTRCYLSLDCSTVLFVENGKIELSLDKDVRNLQVKGSKSHDEYLVYGERTKELSEKNYKLMMELYKKETPLKRKREIEEEQKKIQEQFAEIDDQFIKDYPASAQSAYLVLGKLSGKSAAEIEKIVKSQDPVIQKNPSIAKVLEDAMSKKGIEVDLNELMASVKDISYKVDENFKGETLKDIIYLGVFSNNNICGLKSDGTVQIFDANAKLVKSFKTDLNGKPSSLAIDSDDNIYLLSCIEKEVEKKSRGRVYKRMMPEAVECKVYGSNGKEKSTFKLEGIITATGARVVGNNLVVADCMGSKLVMFDKTTGKKGAIMDNMRPCCGILDFNVNSKNEIVVANLGAFRVQAFDFTGKQLLAFGQRGKTLNDFHGCCNPVSVTNLSNGAIVTVEKDPTRIKVYSGEGAKQIAGIEELVTGCSYIPMIVDGKDNLYLASAEKGIVKCIANI